MATHRMLHQSNHIINLSSKQFEDDDDGHNINAVRYAVYINQRNRFYGMFSVHIVCECVYPRRTHEHRHTLAGRQLNCLPQQWPTANGDMMQDC